MHQLVSATYEKGVLKPLRNLPLVDQQQVYLIVISAPASTQSTSVQPDMKRVDEMQQQVDAWLSTQPLDALRFPESPDQLAPDSDFSSLLETPRDAAHQVRSIEIVADIEQAIAESRLLPQDEIDLLRYELETILAD